MNILMLVALMAVAQPDTISGLATAIDGDTIRVGIHMDMRIRIRGIAAPETYQPGGMAATTRMGLLVNGKVVYCTIPLAAESHDRLVGVCAVDNQDIGYVMTSEGLARDCFAYSGGKYFVTQSKAALSLPLPSYCHDEKRKG